MQVVFKAGFTVIVSIFNTGVVFIKGRCRSCYAFAVTGALESVNALATGKLTTLSEQNIVDCSGRPFYCECVAMYIRCTSSHVLNGLVYFRVI